MMVAPVCASHTALQRDGAPAAAMPRLALEVKDLTVRFGSGKDAFTAVNGVSIELVRGQSFGIVGESGSGKSTVLRAVCGLNAISSGQCLIDGHTIASMPPKVRARRLQMVFQDPYGALHPRQSVDAQLREQLQGHGLEKVSDRVIELLQQVALPPELRFRYPHQLSGGQRQRVCIARALALDPGLLLLDEPTSALDVSVQAEVLRLLARLRAERGMSYLFVSHDLAVVAELCEQIAIMQSGKIVETVTADQLRRGAVEHPYSISLLEAARMRHQRVK